MFDSINMMHDLVFLEKSSNHFFHYKPMLWNVEVWFSRKWMISFKNKNISTTAMDSSSRPSVAFFSKLKDGAMAIIGAILNVHGACRKFALTDRARSFIVNLAPRFPVSVFVPDALSSIFPFRSIFNRINPVHSIEIVSGLSGDINA